MERATVNSPCLSLCSGWATDLQCMLKPRKLVRKILVCGASGILGNSKCILFLHCMLKPRKLVRKILVCGASGMLGNIDCA